MASDIDGAELFEIQCGICHGEDGKLQIGGATDLSTSTLSKEERLQVIVNGRGDMMPFRGRFRDSELKALVNHLDSLKK